MINLQQFGLFSTFSNQRRVPLFYPALLLPWTDSWLGYLWFKYYTFHLPGYNALILETPAATRPPAVPSCGLSPCQFSPLYFLRFHGPHVNHPPYSESQHHCPLPLLVPHKYLCWKRWSTFTLLSSKSLNMAAGVHTVGTSAVILQLWL